jgi:hypothetical protein
VEEVEVDRPEVARRIAAEEVVAVAERSGWAADLQVGQAEAVV